MEFIINKNPWTIPIKFSPYYLYRFNYNFNYGSIWFQIHIQIKTNTLLYHQITLSHFHKIFYCFVTCNISFFFLYMYHSSLRFVISHLKIILFNKSRNFIFFFLLTVMRAAFGISFSSTMRIIKSCASFEHKIHSPKECVQLKHTILHETHTKVKHIQCTHVCYFLTKKKWISIQIENPKNAIDHDI